MANSLNHYVPNTPKLHTAILPSVKIFKNGAALTDAKHTYNGFKTNLTYAAHM